MKIDFKNVDLTNDKMCPLCNKKNIECSKIQLIINDEEKLVKQIMSYESN